MIPPTQRKVFLKQDSLVPLHRATHPRPTSMQRQRSRSRLFQSLTAILDEALAIDVMMPERRPSDQQQQEYRQD
jgi:hypothetical protein